MLRYNYQTMLKRSKNLTCRAGIAEMAELLMDFLKNNHLLKLDPFNEDGSLRSDLTIYSSNLSGTGSALMLSIFPKWSEYIDRGGDAKTALEMQRL